ncbi:MAG: His/Gly/Thr/Pro-type tRNA ligase C-terminal domain-containing protein, partial [Ignavibacteria bacterium]
LNEDAKKTAFESMTELRKKNISCETDLLGRSFKAQMREANKLECLFVFIIGEEELKKNKGLLKTMSDGSQAEVEFNKIADYLK